MVAIKHYSPKPSIHILYVDARGRSYRCDRYGAGYTWRPDPSAEILAEVDEIVRRVLNNPAATWRDWEKLPSGKQFLSSQPAAQQPLPQATQANPQPQPQAKPQPQAQALRRRRAIYPGTCRLTGRQFRAGAAIIEHPRFGWALDDAETGQVLRAIAEASGEIEYHNVLRHGVGATVRHNGQAVTITAVVHIPPREDLDEFDDRYIAFYRPATEAEAAELEAREAAAQARAQAREVLRDAFGRIRAEGTCPDPANGQLTLQGEKVVVARDYAGVSREWLVIDEAGASPYGPAIWAVRNNGADGDDWSLNNVRTGGAGAIGYFVPFDASLAAQIRQAAAALATQGEGGAK